MQTEYSDDIAAARSFQSYKYICTSITTFWTYDYACSLHEEWTFLLGSRWTTVKTLYIVTRIMPCLLLATNLYLNFTPIENLSTCQTLVNVELSVGIISINCSEFFFVLRTYALWNNNKIVLAVMLTGFLALFITSFCTGFTANAADVTNGIPSIAGCLVSVDLFIPFLLLFLFELGLMSLTLICAIRSWRLNSPLYAVLVKHNIFYYACGIVFSAVNVLASVLLHYQYDAMFQDLQLIILAILALRMHLHLFQIGKHVSPDFDAPRESTLECIPLPVISSESHMV
ncbi:uncharacterized protein EDB91DRAFT_384601 [Suillus paluster]|uniref:uncharacterized protein n=1 Tax=Suillus paluster TaxID=48578 RepID=UPI001B85DDAD|nr:uncharacterized protein EDB91DRAFT_384601 [Suillus paluster]KAG1739439.1 hypothetical protein EDB91DRAFT_384601 [Suillus paluster]